MSNYPDGFDDSLLDEPADYDAIARAESNAEDWHRNDSLDAKVQAANEAEYEARMMKLFGDRWIADRAKCREELMAEHRAIIASSATAKK